MGKIIDIIDSTVNIGRLYLVKAGLKASMGVMTLKHNIKSAYLKRQLDKTEEAIKKTKEKK